MFISTHTIIKIGNDGKMLIVCIYVDDLIFTENDMDMLKILKDP